MITTPAFQIRSLETVRELIDHAIGSYYQNKQEGRLVKNDEVGTIDSILYEFMDHSEFIHVDECHERESDGPSLDWTDLD